MDCGVEPAFALHGVQAVMSGPPTGQTRLIAPAAAARAGAMGAVGADLARR
mgnify:CR=1 FL=1